MKAPDKLRGVLACAIAGAWCASVAHADEVAFGLRAGANYSDNVERVPDDERSSSSAMIGFDVSAERDAGRLLYDVFGNIEYQDYSESGVDSETYGQLFATSSYAFVPERFIWGLSGSYDQARRDLLRPVAPGNLEDVITLSTGPQWNMRFGSALEGTLEAHYTTAEYSEQPFDSDTVGGSLIVGRRLSARSFIGLGGSVDEVSYESDDPRAEDFDRHEVFVRFNAQGARTSLDIDAGYSEIDGTTISDGGPMFRLSARRQLGPSVSAFANYVQQYPTSGGGGFSADSAPQLGTDASVLTGAPRKSRSGQIGLQLQGGRTDAMLSYGLRDEEQLDDGSSREFDLLTASMTYAFAPRFSITVFARAVEEQVTAVDSDEKIYGARLNFRAGRLTTISLRAEHRDRDSDDPDGRFDENLAGIYVRYGQPSSAQGWR